MKKIYIHINNLCKSIFDATIALSPSRRDKSYMSLVISLWAYSRKNLIRMPRRINNYTNNLNNNVLYAFAVTVKCYYVVRGFSEAMELVRYLNNLCVSVH